MDTYHIHIEGQVQGVGFRPFVYRLAKEKLITGWVNNGMDGVHIEISTNKPRADEFYHEVTKHAPVLARITRHSFKRIPYTKFPSFRIRESYQKGKPNLMLTPDFAICNDCETELTQRDNKRYEYPFITCTNCGPRYSIVKELPYDRERTTMGSFEMCDSCSEEYRNPSDRRHYSQTNSCTACGISLQLMNAKGRSLKLSQKNIITRTINEIYNGSIVAIKGIGGYLLLADATNQKTVAKLRARKHRPTKPFALMYPSFVTLALDVEINQHEKNAVYSTESPIVLLKLLDNPLSGIAVNEIVPGLNEIGVMRPYAPLFVLIMHEVNRPLIATSGNVSGSPVIYDNRKAIEDLSGIADFILVSNRDIVVPQDDSVMKILPDTSRLIFRRSRGFAPAFFHTVFKNDIPDMLAMGAMLKSTFALTHRGNTYVSQYLGDLECFDTRESYRHTLTHFYSLFNLKPETILVDKHPAYYSSQLGKEMAEKSNINRIQIQHHEAHFMAVLAENDLLKPDYNILGVIWDGTGFGNDGTIWGGEFFTYQNEQIIRTGNIPLFRNILGDKMAREPRLSALSLCNSFGLMADIEAKFTKVEFSLYNKILNSGKGLATTSMGRVFDAVASLLDVNDYNTFEGEAAMHLQAIAERYISTNNKQQGRIFEGTDFADVISQLIDAYRLGEDKGKLAAEFIAWLVEFIGLKAKELDINHIAFSGGVFQNSFLVYLIKERLGKEYSLYFHKRLSPNDECVSFGQLAWYYRFNTQVRRSRIKVKQKVIYD